MKLLKIFTLLLVLLTVSFSKDTAIEQKAGIINIDDIVKKQASLDKKNIVIFFHMTFCPYCIKMQKNALSDERTKKKLESDYIFIDVNVDEEGIVQYKDFKGSKKEFAKALAIAYYPSVVFIDKNNEIVYSLKGYRKTDTFLHTLDYITSKSYLKSDFAGYLFENDVE